MAYKDKEKKREADKAYREKNKEKLKKQSHEYYLKHREQELQRRKKYSQENSESEKKYHKEYHEKNRLQVLAKIDPAMKCANCGCDNPRFLEVNHINGGGRKEQKTRGTGVTQNSILLIQTGKFRQVREV